MTLQELTNQAAGIIVFQDKSVALGDCASLAEEHLLDWTEEPGWADGCEEELVIDIREYLPGTLWVENEPDGRVFEKTDMNIVCEKNPKDYNLSQIFFEYDYDVDGYIYPLANGIVIIAPSAWS